jgi:pyroglutamyl-peptidase
MTIRRSQVKPSGKRSNEKHLAGRRKLYCLITGFDPFAGGSFNPSQAIVESLPEHIRLRKSNLIVKLHGLVLPSCGDAAWKRLKKSIDRSPKGTRCVAILTGVAAKRSLITLERFALNVKDYRVKDNNGHHFAGDPISAAGPQAWRSPIAIDDLVKRLRKRGLPADASNHCGTFVCNEIYYHTFNLQRLKKKPEAFLFVHLPMPAGYGKSLRKLGNGRSKQLSRGRANQLLALQEAIIEIAHALCEQVVAD